MLKRLMILSFILILAVAMVACQGEASQTTTETNEVAATAENANAGTDTAPTTDIKIALSTQLGHPYATAFAELAQKEAGLYGYTLDLFDTKGDLDTQIKGIENAIAAGYDVIIMQPYDAKALIPVTKQAYEAGVKVICAGMELEEEGMQYVETYIGSSGIAEGISGGELCVAALPNGGKVAIIEGAPGHPLVPQRGGEAEKIMEAAGNIEIVAKETGEWDSNTSMTVMENFMTAYPDLDLVYCHDSGMAMGAISAIEQAGKTGEILVVSINGTQEEYDAIRAGTMYGTVLNDVSFIAKNSVRCARDLMEGTPIFDRYISPADKITIENVDNYHAWF